MIDMRNSFGNLEALEDHVEVGVCARVVEPWLVEEFAVAAQTPFLARDGERLPWTSNRQHQLFCDGGTRL
jgi:hypothetical protein